MSGARDTDVLILGASFLGAELVYLLRRRAPQLRVTVVDRQRAHGYIPLVHERLVGRIDWDASVLRTAEFVAREGATFVEGEVSALDPRRKCVTLADGRTLRARFIVVALGSVTTPPAQLPGREHFVGHKLASEADDARARLARVLGSAHPDRSAALASTHADLSAPHVLASARDDGSAARVVVVGAGISGVELAGELAHLAKHRASDWRAPMVTLVHGESRVVPHLSSRVSDAVESRLVAQHIVIRKQTQLVAADAHAVTVVDDTGREETLRADLAFWCGGVRPAPVLASLGLPRTADGWLAVRPTLECGAFGPDIFAGGDCARVVDEHGVRWPTMQRAIECLWAADTIAAQLARLAKEKPGYPRAIPALRRHPLRADFFHGLSLGRESLVVRGDEIVDLGAINVGFRRFLMWGYLRRYGQF